MVRRQTSFILYPHSYPPYPPPFPMSIGGIENVISLAALPKQEVLQTLFPRGISPSADVILTLIDMLPDRLPQLSFCACDHTPCRHPIDESVSWPPRSIGELACLRMDKPK